jgi:hypothetical protein
MNLVSPFPAVRYSLFVYVSICLCFLWLTAARLLKHAVALPQIRTGLPLPSGRGISFGLFFFGEMCHPTNVSPSTNVSPLQGSMACFVSILQMCHPAGV